MLIERYRETGDRQVLDGLTADLLPWLRQLARRFSGRGIDDDDLIQVASLGLVKALDRFDPARGIRFATFAEPTISGEIKRHFRDRGWAVRTPRDLQELSIQLTRAIDFLTGDLGRSPKVSEISAYLGVGEEAVLDAMHVGAAYTADSLDLPTDDDGPQPPVLSTYDSGYDTSEQRVALGTAFELLSPRDRLIMHMRFFEDLTQADIAGRLDISQMQVSRVIRASLARLRSAIDTEIESDQ